MIRSIAARLCYWLSTFGLVSTEHSVSSLTVSLYPHKLPENTCYHAVQNLLLSHLLSKNVKIKIYNSCWYYQSLLHSQFTVFFRTTCGHVVLHRQTIAPMMEAARTSETLVNFYQTTRCYNPEDSHLHTHRRENLKSYFSLCLSN
jgi:hypothetical protein